MKFISILLLLVAIITGMALTVGACIVAYLAWTRGFTRDIITFPLLGAGAVLAFRTAVSLGSFPAVLRDRRKMAEVAAFSVLVISLPIGGFLERRTEGIFKTAVHCSTVFAIFAAYVVVLARYRVSSPDAQPTRPANVAARRG